MTQSVIIEDMTKIYKLYGRKLEKLKDLVSSRGAGEDFYALRDVNLTFHEGDVIGVIGVNGAGKSTLSQIIGGVIPPTSGTVTCHGDTSIIAVNAGLDKKLTGRQNIHMKLLMLGFSPKEIAELEPAIIDFAEIGQFIDQLVKTYSSGMKSRLGFGISVNVDPDILVIDEALSVGDQTFTDKCLERMNEFKRQGKTIFFISHSLGQVNDFCDKVVWLEYGSVRQYGDVADVIPEYRKFLKEFRKLSKAEQKKRRKQALKIQQKA